GRSSRRSREAWREERRRRAVQLGGKRRMRANAYRRNLASSERWGRFAGEPRDRALAAPGRIPRGRWLSLACGISWPGGGPPAGAFNRRALGPVRGLLLR